jgi:hypothetical protein
MKRILVWGGLILVAASLLPSSILCQDKLEIRAKIWNYGSSICSFNDPPSSSGYKIKPASDKVTLEVMECKKFEEKFGHPVAISVALKNGSPSAMDVMVDKDLTSVAVTTKDNQTIPAVAKRFMVEGPMGGTKMEYVYRADASYKITLDPGQEINVVYLFPKAAAGDTITVSKLKPVKIE